jgi:hypothetical protein
MCSILSAVGAAVNAVDAPHPDRSRATVRGDRSHAVRRTRHAGQTARVPGPPTQQREPKTCASCGRRIEWRKKWERDWPAVRYCSTLCRRRGLRPVDGALEAAIVALLDERANGATICPSEAARRVASDRGSDGDDWRDLMEPARAAARRLVDAGAVELTQGGRVVDPSTARGAIRIRRRPP